MNLKYYNLHNLEYITGTKVDITAGSNIKELEKFIKMLKDLISNL